MASGKREKGPGIQDKQKTGTGRVDIRTQYSIEHQQQQLLAAAQRCVDKLWFLSHNIEKKKTSQGGG